MKRQDLGYMAWCADLYGRRIINVAADYYDAVDEVMKKEGEKGPVRCVLDEL